MESSLQPASQAEAPNSSSNKDGGGYLGIQVISSGTEKDAQPLSQDETGQWEESPNEVQFEQACIADDITQFGSLSLQIAPGQHTLVVGGSRAQRTSLGAVLAAGSHRLIRRGRVRGPRPHRDIIHVSGTTRPYVRAGSSLWDALVFPHDKAQSQRRGVQEHELEQMLEWLGFACLLERVDGDWARVIDWAKALDRRERAALLLCRLLYHAPNFALIDDEALAELLPAQVRQVFGAANLHHITIIVLAHSDPFDTTLLSTPPPSSSSTSVPLSSQSSPGFLPCIGEFSRALRISSEGWEFSSFGYGSADRAAFDTQSERQWVWARQHYLEERHADRERRLRLQRRTSTLSQCSTTERRWLVTPEFPMSPAAAERCTSPLLRRQSSRLASPMLSARSSISDLAMAANGSHVDYGSVRSRLQTIDSAIASFATVRQPSPCLQNPEKLIEESKLIVDEAKFVDEPALEATVVAAPEAVAAEASLKSGPAGPEKKEDSAKSDFVVGGDIVDYQPANRYARPRNYRRSTRPGLRLSPRHSPKPAASELSFIPPSSPQPPPKSPSPVQSADNADNKPHVSSAQHSSAILRDQNVNVGNRYAMNYGGKTSGSGGALSAAAAAASSLRAAAQNSVEASHRRRYQRSQKSPKPNHITSAASSSSDLSRIPRPPTSASTTTATVATGHSRASSFSSREPVSSASSVASVSVLSRSHSKIAAPTANPIDELATALQNM
ncbi:ATP-binding cassette long-chain fatty acid transporter pxa2 [Coemansia brasiliensis]|uniref:ATP-binding cassette long-chain fatty acid transporter pxa2 n=1 Tax=Coemansia brasiliensis TaxID=2650707 RepID=A0A9W8LXW9_9FUNG|nr:ATP-binding cassette long-chain fatty acid transporter pxa2 [Coemansia brasiliensis]